LKFRRNRLEIISEILSTATEGTRKTAIVHKVNLNFTRSKKYLALLLEEGMIGISRASAVNYKTTEKGINFLRAYEEKSGFVGLFSKQFQ
jgi:predicted transcriptional regulator